MKLNRWNHIFTVAFGLTITWTQMHACTHMRAHTHTRNYMLFQDLHWLIPLLTMNTILAIWGIAGPKQPFEDYSQMNVEGGGGRGWRMEDQVRSVCVWCWWGGGRGGAASLIRKPCHILPCAGRTRCAASNPPSKSPYACYSIRS